MDVEANETGLDPAGRGPLIVTLGDPRSADRHLVGGKAGQLGRLAAHFRVPPGFCLTTAAYHSAQEFGLDTAVARLRQSLADAYAALGEPAVAVRSSAVDEDGTGSSFAGQLETYLNIRGLDALVEAVARCWRSGSAERVASYRREQGLNLLPVGVAVLIQELVNADWSAVAFSANPITGDRGEIVVNASYGLGESIVSGTVTPDAYVLRKSDLSLRSCRIGDKLRMTIRTAGGTREVAVPRLMQRAQVLDAAALEEVGRLTLDLESATGCPVDVECASAAGTLYLLQCRPVTTLQTES